LAILSFSGVNAAPPSGLEGAEVRLPYEELRRLIEASREKKEESAPIPPALVLSRLKLSMDGDTPVIDGEFRTVRFSEGFSRVALIGGDLSIESQETEGDALVMHDSMLCRVDEGAGSSDTRLRFRTTGDRRGFELVFPACPGTMVDTSGLPEQASLAVTQGKTERIIPRGGRYAVPAEQTSLRFRILDEEESLEALRPPEPSSWSWQHQALVIPEEGELRYRILSHASAADGSGVDADLKLPSDARDVTATGDDLLEVRVLRDDEGNPRVHLSWKSRDVLERDVEIFYRVPLRPLDERWVLSVPVAEKEGSTKTRFIIPALPSINFEAEGLSGPIVSESVGSVLSKQLAGSPCYFLEGESSVEMKVRRLPVVATDDAVIPEATWLLSMERDGSMLAEGVIEVEHGMAQGVVLDMPDGMLLLSCQVEGRAVEPVNLGESRIEIAVPARGEGGAKPTRIALSFTSKGKAFDPLEGTLALALPQTPLFIRSLTWRVDLPSGYTAEISGNLTWEAGAASDPASSIRMRKKLCRDERPEVQVFYQSRHLLP